MVTGQLTDFEIFQLYLSFNRAILADYASKKDSGKFLSAEDLEVLYFFETPPDYDTFARDLQCLNMYPEESKELRRILDLGYEKFIEETSMFFVDTKPMSNEDSVVFGEFPRVEEAPQSLIDLLSPFKCLLFFSDYKF